MLEPEPGAKIHFLGGVPEGIVIDGNVPKLTAGFHLKYESESTAIIERVAATPESTTATGATGTIKCETCTGNGSCALTRDGTKLWCDPKCTNGCLTTITIPLATETAAQPERSGASEGDPIPGGTLITAADSRGATGGCDGSGTAAKCLVCPKTGGVACSTVCVGYHLCSMASTGLCKATSNCASGGPFGTWGGATAISLPPSNDNNLAPAEGLAVQKGVNREFTRLVVPKLRSCWPNPPTRASIGFEYKLEPKTQDAWVVKEVRVGESSLDARSKEAAQKCMGTASKGTTMIMEPWDGMTRNEPLHVFLEWPAPLPPARFGNRRFDPHPLKRGSAVLSANKTTTAGRGFTCDGLSCQCSCPGDPSDCPDCNDMFLKDVCQLKGGDIVDGTCDEAGCVCWEKND